MICYDYTWKDGMFVFLSSLYRENYKPKGVNNMLNIWSCKVKTRDVQYMFHLLSCLLLLQLRQSLWEHTGPFGLREACWSSLEPSSAALEDLPYLTWCMAVTVDWEERAGRGTEQTGKALTTTLMTRKTNFILSESHLVRRCKHWAGTFKTHLCIIK